MSFSIKFPIVRVRPGYSRRILRVIDTTGLTGARACAARSLNGAIRYRDERQPSYLSVEEAAMARRIALLGMRADALWARVFAGQIANDDPRIDQAMTERTGLVRQYCNFPR